MRKRPFIILVLLVFLDCGSTIQYESDQIPSTGTAGQVNDGTNSGMQLPIDQTVRPEGNVATPPKTPTKNTPLAENDTSARDNGKFDPDLLSSDTQLDKNQDDWADEIQSKDPANTSPESTVDTGGNKTDTSSTPDQVVWPNGQSSANGDRWLIDNHDRIVLLEPKLLVLNFVNPSNPEEVAGLIERINAAFAEGSREHGYSTPNAQIQFSYQVLGIRDLRDGVGGRSQARPGYAFENSSLTPRRSVGESGSWTFKYADLFRPAFAQYLGFKDPDDNTRYLTLCELIDRGIINELWVVVSGDVPDVNAAEVLEHKQGYSSNNNPIANNFNSCAGNGCFDADVPKCARSVRIGAVNYNRGPGCYLESMGHAIESMGRNNIVPTFTRWFVPFARFDLDTTEGLPFRDMYGINCGNGDCLSYPDPETTIFNHGGTEFRKPGFDPVCGNVHYPPNGRRNYDIDNAIIVNSSCVDFGLRSDGTRDRKAPVSAARLGALSHHR